MVIDGLYPVVRREVVRFAVKVVGRVMYISTFIVRLDSRTGGTTSSPNSNAVLNQPFVDSLRGMGHKDAAFERRFGHDVGQAGCMIQMEMADQQHIHRTQIEFVVKGQSCQAIVGWVYTGVQHHGFPFVLKDMT